MTESNFEKTDSDSRNDSQVSIVELGPDQWEVLRDLKLKSLEQEPIAMANPEPERRKLEARSEAEWRDILAGKMSGGRAGESLHAFAKDPSGKYLGMVSAIVPAESKLATIQNMYVDPESRGQKIGSRLLSNLVNRIKSRGDVKKIELQVVTIQEPAIKMYNSLGFVEKGLLPKAAKRGDGVYDEYQMELDL